MTRRNLSAPEIIAIARAAHEVNRTYAMLLGDGSHLAWDDAPEWQRSTAIAGVLDIAANEYTPEQSHEAWRVRKMAEGWRHGQVKDVEAKTHPCLVPYADLPEHERYKDVLYTTVVKGMLDGLWRLPQ